MELVAGAAVVGEQQEADRHLRHQQRLSQRQEVGRERPRAPSAPVEDAADEGRAHADGDYRNPEPRMDPRHAASVAEPGGYARANDDVEARNMVEEGAPAPDFSLTNRRWRDGDPERAARQAGRSLLLSQGRHARLHGAGVRDPGRLQGVRGRRRGRARRQPRRRGSHAKFKQKYDLPFTLLADADHDVADTYGVWGEKTYAGKTYMGIDRSTFVIGPDGNVAKVFRKVKPDEHADQVLEALRA